MPISKLVKYHGQKVEYQQKDLITRNTHVKYQSSSTHYSNVISKIKVLISRSNSKVKVTRSILLVSTGRPFLIEYSCEILKLWHSLFKGNYM